jgi:hypothetical protein
MWMGTSVKGKAPREGRVGEQMLAGVKEQHRLTQQRINQRNSMFPKGAKLKVKEWPKL